MIAFIIQLKTVGKLKPKKFYFNHEEKHFAYQNLNSHCTHKKTEKLEVKVWITILGAKIYTGAEKRLLYSLLSLTLGNGSLTPSRLEMIKLTADGDDELPSGAESCYALLCDMGTHQKENFTKILRGELGERSWTEKNQTEARVNSRSTEN